MDKWEYISEISRRSDEYGNLLIELMERNNKNSLREITEQEAKEFYEEIELKGE